MPVDARQDAEKMMKRLTELRALAAAKLRDDPLPVGREATTRLHADIKKYELEKHIVELELDGYTILPPGKAGPIELFDRVHEAMLRIASEQSRTGPLGQTLFHLLPQDRVFEKALMAPVPGTLLTYVLGHRAKLGQSTGIIKEAGVDPLYLHADHSLLPPPWPVRAQINVVTWVLTDYTRENGAVCVWPGSHRWAAPVPEPLRMVHDHPETKVLATPPGSVIIWHGGLWHGAVPRQTEGARMTLALPFQRAGVQATEPYTLTVTPEMIECNPRRFSTFIGLHSAFPWLDGPDGNLLAITPNMSEFE